MANIRVQNQGNPASTQELLGANSVELSQISDVSINLDNLDIASLAQQGNDLVVTLTNGEQLLIENFFVPGSDGSLSRLFVSENGTLELVQLEQSVGSGLSSASYAGQAVSAQNSALVFAQEAFLVPGTGAAAGTFTSGFVSGAVGGGLGAVAAGVGAVGTVAALSGGGSADAGGDDDGGDTIAPKAPSINVASGVEISGTGEPGATIGIDTNGDGRPDLTTTVAPDGTWSVVPSPALADGTSVSITQTDASGNESSAASGTVDAVAPALTVAVASGTEISGTGEPGAEIGVDTNGDGTPDLTTTVAPDGTWSVAPSPALTDGTSVSAVQTDPDGNESPADVATIDSVAPATPLITSAPTTGDTTPEISGTAEAGSTVSVEIDVDGDGTADATYEVTADPSGNWSVDLENDTPVSGTAPTMPLSDGDTLDVSVTATDAAGNSSAAAEQTVTVELGKFSVSDVSADEAAGTMTFTVSRDGDVSLAQDVSAAVFINGGDTASAADFSAAGQVLSFAAGETSKTYTVTLTDDAAYEGDETFTVQLSNPTNGSIISVLEATGTITDEADRPQLSLSNMTVDESAGTVTVQVNLSQAIDTDVTFDYSLGGSATLGTDYTSTLTASGTLTIPAGSTSVTADLVITDDSVFEGNEDAVLTISNPSANAIISVDTGTVTITDNETPSEVSVANNVTVDEAAGTVNFTVVRTGDSSGISTVDYNAMSGTAASGADFVAASGTVIFAAGETSKLVTVIITDDAEVEADETFTLELSNPTNTVVGTASATATITDNDVAAEVSVSDVSGTEGGSATITVVRSGNTTGASTVDYSLMAGTASEGADFTAGSGTVSFAAGETSKTINVTIVDDGDVEDDETLTVNLSNASAGTNITTASATVTINDNDNPATMSIAGSSANENDGTITFTVTRTGDLGHASSVDYVTSAGTASDGTDFTIAAGSVAFAAGESIQDITVSLIDNADVDGDKNFTVDLSNPSSGDSVGVATATGTILDDDTTAPRFVVSDTSVVEGDAGTTQMVFTVERVGDTSGANDVDYAVGASGDGSTANLVLDSDDFADVDGTALNTTTTAGGLNWASNVGTFTVNSGAVSASGSSWQGHAVVDTGDTDVAMSATITNGGTSWIPLFVLGHVDGANQLVMAIHPNARIYFYEQVAGTNTFRNNSIILDEYPANGDTFEAGVIKSGDTVTVLINGEEVGSYTDAGVVGGLTGTSHGFARVGNAVTIDDFAISTAGSGLSDYAANDPFNGTLSFAAGETSKTVTIDINGDDVEELDETVNITLSNATGGATISTETASGTISNDDIAAHYDIADVSANEADGTLTFTVTRSGNTADATTVDFASVDGTAVDGADYTAVTGTVSFAAGETSQTITVTIADDADVEVDETFTVELSNASNGGVIDTDSATGTIVNDDTPAEFSVADTSGTEGDAVTFTVTRSGNTAIATTVDYAIADGTAVGGTAAGADYDNTTTTGTLSFAAGETEKTVTIDLGGTITDLDDAIYDADETFTMTLSNPGANSEITTDTGTATIIENDAISELIIDDVSINEADGTATFTVTRTGDTTGTADVDYSLLPDANGTDQANLRLASDTFTAADGTLLSAHTPDEGSAWNTSGNWTINSGAVAWTSGGSSYTANAFLETGSTEAYMSADITLSSYTSHQGLFAFNATGNNSYMWLSYHSNGRIYLYDRDTGDGGAQVSLGSVIIPTGTLAAGQTNNVSAAKSGDTITVWVDGTEVASFTNDAIADETGTQHGLWRYSGATPTFDNLIINSGEGDIDVSPLAAGTLNFLAGEDTKTITVAVNDDGDFEPDETYSVVLNNAVGASIADDTGIGTIVNDDAAPSISVADVTTSEASGVASITVTLDSVSVLAHSVDYAFAAGTATAGDDFEVLSGTVTFEPGETSQTILVNIPNDAVYEGAETFTATLSNPTGGATLGTNIGTVTITDEGDAPAIAIADAPVVNEGGDLEFTVTRTGDLSSALSVDFATSDGTATAGTDYTSATGTVSFAAGENTTTVTVSSLNDGVVEAGDETVTVTLSNPSAGAITTDTATGTIADVGTVPTLEISDAGTVMEGVGAQVTFTVTRGGDTSVAVDVDYTTANGGASSGLDFTPNSGTLSFASGETEKTVTVDVLDDAVFEIDETFFVNLSNPTGGATIVDGKGEATITPDADAIPVVQLAGDVTVVEDAGFANFTLNRVGANNVISSVDYVITAGTASDGSDIVVTSGTASFGAGSATATIQVRVREDLIDELDENFTIDISNPVNATLGATVSATGTITDNDDAPALSVSDVVVDEASGTATVTVSLSGASGQAVTVDYATADGSASAGSDYTAATGTLSFAAGETEKTFDVAITDDGDTESLETIAVSLSNASNATISAADATISIADDDTAIVEVAVSDVTVDEGDGAVTFTITRNGDSSGTSSVQYATADGSAVAGDDYTAASGTITFEAGEVSKEVTVDIIDDNVDDDGEDFALSLSDAIDATITTASATASITDNDDAPIINIGNASISEDVGTIDFVVSMTTASTGSITVDYSAAGGTATAGSDFVATSGTLTFAPGETSKVVSLTVVNDSELELAESLTVTLANPTGGATIGTASGAGNIIDDDVEPTLTVADVSVDESAGTMTFTVERVGNLSLESTVKYTTAGASAVEDPFCPTPMTAGSDATSDVDFTAAAGMLTFAAGESSKTVVVTIAEDTDEENSEALTFNLAEATNAQIGTFAATGTIIDNDGAERFSVADVRVGEGDGSATITIFRGGDTSLATDIDYATSDGATDGATAGSDYVATSGTLSFAAGETSKTFTIDITDDVDNFERSEQIDITLSNATNGTIADGSSTVTIVENDVVRLSLDDIANGVNGFTVKGESDNYLLGWATNSADVNGDGIDDLIVTFGNGTNSGWLFYGNTDGVFDLNLDGSDGIFFDGGHILPIGDINNDGLDDLNITSYVPDTHNNLIFGREDWGTGVVQAIDIENQIPMAPGSHSILDTSDSRPLDTTPNIFLSGSGDVNGDGFNDWYFTATYAGTVVNHDSYAAVVFGDGSEFPVNFDLDSYQLDGTDGFLFLGTNTNINKSRSVYNTGDIDGDGFSDMAFTHYNEIVEGQGRGDGSAADRDGGLSILYGGTNIGAGGLVTEDQVGVSVRGVNFTSNDDDLAAAYMAGDVNGDGIDDILINGVRSGEGSISAPTYLVYGVAGGLSGTINLTTDYAQYGVKFDNSASLPYQGFRFEQSSTGDINGDGLDDIVFSGDYGDAIWVVYGQQGGFDTSSIFVNEYATGSQGFQFDMPSGSTRNSASILDFNGDGYADLSVASDAADLDGFTNNGFATVIYGGDFTGKVSQEGTSGDDMLIGTELGDNLLGGQGDDHLCGKGGADALNGGLGNDTLVVSDADFIRLDGGAGFDTALWAGVNIDLDLASAPSGLIKDIEHIDLTGSGGNMLTMNVQNVLNISSTTNTLQLSGDADDTVTLQNGDGGTAWAATGTTQVINDQVYSEYAVGAATVLIDNDVQVVV